MSKEGNLSIFSCSQMKVLDYGLITVAEELQHVAHTSMNPNEPTENTNDIQDEEVCIVALDKHVKQALKGLDKTDARRKSVVKNVTNFRHQIIKEFMSSYMGNKRRYCPVCKAPSREVRSEHNSRVFLKGLSSREAHKWVQTKIVQAHMAKQSAHGTNSTNDNNTGKLHFLQ